MRRGGGGPVLLLVACVLLTSSSSFAFVARNGTSSSSSHAGGGASDPQGAPDPRQGPGDARGRPSDEGEGHRDADDASSSAPSRAAQDLILSQFLRSAEEKMLGLAAGRNGSNGGRGSNSLEKWQCLVEWMRARDRQASRKDGATCQEEAAEGAAVGAQEKALDECVPVLFLVIPSLCNGTDSCINVTEASLESFLHRYWLWDRKRKRREESTDAVIYIVVVLAFYSFGIVFMMANFVRQEQRELEETKLYKQYVKLARDRWLTSRGSLANRLALQALNTLNAVPQTTDVNKVTFV